MTPPRNTFTALGFDDVEPTLVVAASEVHEHVWLAAEFGECNIDMAFTVAEALHVAAAIVSACNAIDVRQRPRPAAGVSR